MAGFVSQLIEQQAKVVVVGGGIVVRVFFPLRGKKLKILTPQQYVSTYSVS